MYCKSCGSQVRNDAYVCVKCGVKTGGSSEMSSSLIATSYILAFLLPIIGVVMAIVAAAKGEVKHLFGILVVSILSWIFWMAVFAETLS